MSAPRPVFLGHTAAPSGAELAFARLAGALRHRGVPASVMLLAPGPLTDVLSAADVPVTVVPGSPPAVRRDAGPLGVVRAAVGLYRAGRRLAPMLLAADADVVVAESTKSLLVGAVASRRTGIPLVWQVHDRLSAEYFGRKRFPLRLLGRVAASGYLANSRGTLRTISTGGSPTAVCHPGVDLSTVPAAAPQRAPKSVKIAMIGRITPWKGQDLLLRALAQMEAQPEVRFVGGAHFDGDDRYLAELEELAERLGVAHRVTFTGHVADPLAEAADADVVVHYSRLTEPFGQVVAEAMAAGRVVVAARAGGPTELIVDGQTGVLVPPRRPDQLAVALDALIADWELREQLAAAARDRSRDLDLKTSAAIADSLLARVARDVR
ncbi:glycosyltransferase [Tsukamurella ocularis]|uniref:glycosyltransferase n=1 Tax=Tsukamurella ocularis TaxID=1970234 RepID=UPI0021670CD5|nr:glycosyltransferase [Tsukamurella ocularis]MCS3779658.1 glycosyltransferase involved in cell wall biosynthesis [Tsukamurella ocularis]MCS3788942.1 glycosyltransferase involved in cell wall biosynthesis [Tsukamurella ocularis]MCS3850152.1 glycosyltransferase involved in cell wall biosynthesis [Tsukamurella ocularis]